MSEPAPGPVPQTMSAIAITSPGGPEVLRPEQRPVPAPAAGELLIRVAAAGVNRPDVMQRQGVYNPPPGASDLPGLEVAGTVAALGEGVSGWQVGDPCCALVNGGGYAEYCPAPAGQVLPLPAGLSLVEAAGLPETFFTVWSNLFDRGQLKAGEATLIHGGSSGIGTTAIQLAKAFGARVFTTAGSDEKCAFCAALGADRPINYRREDYLAVIKAETGGRGVDVVLDMLGGEALARNLQALAADGRHVSIAIQEGPKATLNIFPLMAKRLTVTGSTLRPRSVADKAAIAAALRAQVWPLLEQKVVRPVIHRTFPLAEAAAAHALMESSQHIGKIILTVA